MIEPLYTIPEVAKILRRKEATIRDWRADRRNLDFIKVDGGVLVEESELRRYIAENKVKHVAKTVGMGDHGEQREVAAQAA
jgi:hypothetical protein